MRDDIGTYFKKHTVLILVVLVLAAFVLGYLIRGEKRPELMPPTEEQLAELAEPVHLEGDVLYACPMMCITPRESEGLCPVCGMELFGVPKEDHDHGDEPPRIELTRQAEVLAEVELAEVERRFVPARVRCFGQIVVTPESLLIGETSGLMARLFVYESDIAKLRHGQQVTFETDAYPGRTFKGAIVFIGVLNDAQTRTISVGVAFDDPQGVLIPGLIIRADIALVYTAEGIVAAGELPPEAAPLVIPASAPLVTGERAVVYVAVPGLERTFEGREIVLGPRARDHYLVLSGLEAGEMVVAHGAFKIDSALQIQARPSMMNPGAVR